MKYIDNIFAMSLTVFLAILFYSCIEIYSGNTNAFCDSIVKYAASILGLFFDRI